MTNQFIAHADTPRTFADKKGATKAIKRDLAKHDEVHGDILFETGFDVKESGDRFGVVIYCDLTEDAARKLVGNELAGYVIEPQLKAEPAPKPATAPAPKADDADKVSRRKGQVSVDPTSPLIHCRAGSKQQGIVDKLSAEGGATLDDLRSVCVKKDGTPWDDNSIRSALYYDIKDKGYGVRTEFNDDVPTYFIVLPAGYDAPLPAKGSKAVDLAQKIIDWATENYAKSYGASCIIETMTKDEVREEFKTLAEAKAWAKLQDEARSNAVES